MEDDCTLAEKVDLLLAGLKAEIVRLVEAEVSAARDKIDTSLEKSSGVPTSEVRGGSPKRTGFDSIKPDSCPVRSDYKKQSALCDNEGQGLQSEGKDLEAPQWPTLTLSVDPSHGTLNESTASPSESSETTEAGSPSKSTSARTLKVQFLQYSDLALMSTLQKKSKYVLMPTNHCLMAWHIANAILIILCVWADSLSIVDTFPGGFGPLGFQWEVFVLCFFGIDMLLTFNVAVEHDHGFCKNRCVIAKKYLKSWFLLDLITLVPWAFLTGSFSGKAGRVARLGKIVKMLKFLRFAKLFKILLMSDTGIWLSEWFDHVSSLALGSEEGAHSVLKLTRIVSGIFQYLVLMFLESFIVVCVLLDRHDQPDLRWSHEGTMAVDLSVWNRYWVATLWTFNSLAVGAMEWRYLRFHGSMISAMQLQFVVSAFHAINVLFLLYIHSEMQGADDLDFAVKVRLMRFFLRRQEVTEMRRRKVLGYLRAVESVRTQKKLYKVIEHELSPHLRSALAVDIYGQCLTRFAAFHSFPFTELSTYSKLIHDICGITVSVVFPDKHVVISASQRPVCMYFLRSGQVVVHNSEEESALTKSRPSGSFTRSDQVVFYAVECIFSPAGAPWNAEGDVVTTDCCEFGRVTRSDFDNLIQSALFPEIWLSFIKFLRSKVGDGSLVASELEHGLDQSVCEEWKQIEAQNMLAKRRGGDHHELGISCEYLVHRFAGDLRKELKDCDCLKMTFNNLAKCFWLDAHKGFRGSADFTCPRDNRRGSSIVDALDDREKGKATVFVSWCWRYNVETLVSSMGRWAAAHKRKASSCFLWICFFCNNQRKLLVDKEPDKLAETFGPKLMAIGSMVMVFDTYEKPLYTSRLWCIYEAFTARKVGIELEVAMPASCQEEFQKELVDGGLVDIQQSLTKISVEDAEATFPSDKEEILDLVAKSIGFEAVNEGVKCALMSWLTVAFQDCLQKSTISESAQIVFSLIKMSHSDHDQCSLTEFMLALERHPGLLEFLDLSPNMSSEDVYASLEPGSSDTSQQLSVKSLDSYLKKCHKHTMGALAKWLSHWGKADPALRELFNEVAGRVQAKTRALKDQLEESESALHDLQETARTFAQFRLEL